MWHDSVSALRPSVSEARGNKRLTLEAAVQLRCPIITFPTCC